MQPDSTDLWTDRSHLTTAAYGTSANLMARGSIYQYQQPSIDIVGWALGHVEWRGDEQAVDVGCGPGAYLRRLAQQAGLRLIGLDLSRGMLADLERSWDAALPRPHLAVADAQALPLPDASCDVLLAMHMLYHVPDIPRAVREFRRVLRANGVLLAVTNSDAHMQELNAAYEAAVAAVAGAATPFPRASHRFRLEDGAAVLRAVFDHVERHDVSSLLVVPEPEPILRYVASTRSVREPDLPAGATWDAVIAELEQRVRARIAEPGAFRIRTSSGVFVCR